MYSHHDRTMLAAISYKQDLTLAMLHLLFRQQRKSTAMNAEQQTKLIAKLSENTNATQAAHDALLTYATSTSELTAKLQAALAAANVEDPAVQQAIETLANNTQSLVAATPQVAVAVTNNTREQQAPDAPPPSA